MFSFRISPTCPSCSSTSIHRSRRRGLHETILSYMHVTPYRCTNCDDRHLRFTEPKPQLTNRPATRSTSSINSTRPTL